MILAALLFLAVDPPPAPAPAADGWALFARHCLSCHAPGGSAPLLLETRGAIARKSATISTVLRERFMPPWLPAGGGPFAHDALTDAERDAIAAWAKAGAPGAPEVAVAADPPRASCTMTVADGWEIPADGLQMRTFADKASDQATHCALGDSPAPGIGTVRVRRSSSAVERVMLSLDRTGSLRALDRDDPGLGAHVRADAPCAPAGSLAMIGVDGEFRLPAGWCLPRPFAAAVPPGASIATEIHAAGRGTPMSGAVRIDFEPAAGSAEPRRVAESFCAGPLGAIREERTGTTTRTDSGALVRDVQVGVIGLRTDERCTAVRVTAIAPGGAERVLLDIPKYREALDRAYRFEPPVALVCGTLLRIDTVHADENAVMRSQPMAILWCAAAEGSVFPPRAQQPVERVQAMDAAAVPGASAAEGITWFDAVAACNERSAREGLPPAYRIEHMERVDGRIVRAQVTRTPSAGWRLPRAADIAAEPAAPADAWWWTDDESGLSGFTIVSPRNGQRDSVPPSVRIPGLWSGMTRPAVAPSAK